MNFIYAFVFVVTILPKVSKTFGFSFVLHPTMQKQIKEAVLKNWKGTCQHEDACGNFVYEIKENT